MEQKKPSKSLTVLQYGLGRCMLEKTRHQQGPAISPHVLCGSGFCSAGFNLPGQAARPAQRSRSCVSKQALRRLHLLCWSQGRSDRGPSQETFHMSRKFPTEKKRLHTQTGKAKGEWWVGEKAAHWASRGSEMPEIGKCGQKRISCSVTRPYLQLASPGRAHGKLGGRRGPCLQSQS